MFNFEKVFLVLLFQVRCILYMYSVMVTIIIHACSVDGFPLIHFTTEEIKKHKGPPVLTEEER